MAKITLDYYGVTGSGRTVTEAKKDAGERIRAAISGSYSPQIVTRKGYAVLVYREPFSGWCTQNIADEDGIRSGNGCSCHGYEDQYEALKAARMHVAQMSWLPEDGLTAPEPFLPEREAREFVSWAKFQLACIRLRSEGIPDGEIHQKACEAMYA